MRVLFGRQAEAYRHVEASSISLLNENERLKEMNRSLKTALAAAADKASKLEQTLHRSRELVEREPQIREDQVNSSLASLVDHPGFDAAQTRLRAQIDIEEANALRPNLDDSSRQYNAGRAAALLDWQSILVESIAAAETSIRGL